jgi:hypothetical protein
MVMGGNTSSSKFFKIYCEVPSLARKRGLNSEFRSQKPRGQVALLAPDALG